ncbi:MAG: hypothetical protein GKR89_06990 [Candidatus Latescibacteria bacterium]|nr:hypothetical protein [Candidatus Latescibacterota bacterium]
MKSLTIHMDDALAQKIREKAAAEKKSLNKTITGVLQQVLGEEPVSHKADFLDQCGVWDAAQQAEFDHLTQRQVDPEDWQ